MLPWPEGRDEFNGPHHLSSNIMTTLILFGASKSPIQAPWPNRFEFGGGQRDWTGLEINASKTKVTSPICHRIFPV